MPNMLPDTSGSAASIDDGIVRWGDLVVVHESIHVMKSAYLTKGGRYDSKFGHFKHEDWVGVPFGSKVYSAHGAKGFVFLLKPSPDLWSLVLRHRTQILYIADCSLISFYLELAPGSVVLESGTGSAALTHALARAVAPTGHVHTFEFHKERSEEARRELGLHGMGDFVTVGHRNIMDLGFPKELEEKGDADGVFLDLPGPWKVVESAAKCLRPDGKFCSFSPCIEQVQRTSEEMEKHGFTDIITVEVLLRVHEVRSEQLVKIPPPPLAPAAAPIAPAQDGPASADTEAVAASASQAEGNGSEAAAGAEAAGTAGVAEGAKATEGAEAMEGAEVAGGAEVTEGAKAAEGAEGGGGAEAICGATMEVDQVNKQAEAGVGAKATEGSKMEVDKVDKQAEEKDRAQGGSWAQGGKKRRLEAQADEVIMVTSKPSMEARGHTGYLTFARKFVVPEKKDVTTA